MKRPVFEKFIHSFSHLIIIFFAISIVSCAGSKKSLNENEVIEKLLGKWSGTWMGIYQHEKGQNCSIIIDKVSRDQSIFWLTYTVEAESRHKFSWAKYAAEYISPDKFKWETTYYVYKFHLREGILLGTKTRAGWEEQITMKKVSVSNVQDK